MAKVLFVNPLVREEDKPRHVPYGIALLAAIADKRGHLVRTALEYARRAGVAPDRLRFDVVGVVVEPKQRVELWKNVFSAANPRGTWRRL